MEHTTYLITGATGNQGRAVINALIKQDAGKVGTILAVTRNDKSAAAKKLAALDARIKVLKGDLNDVDDIFRTAERLTHGSPIYGVFSVQISRGSGVTSEGEIKQGTALIDASIANGVKHFVYSSVERGGDDDSWVTPTPVEHFRTKYIIERHLRHESALEPRDPTARMTWTILRPVAFMENLKPGLETKVFLTALQNHLDPAKKMQWVSTVDIGKFAAKVFADPKTWRNRAVGIAGDELTMEELLDTFSKSVGYPTSTTYWPLGSLLTWAVKEMREMIQWFASDGYQANVAARRKDLPELMTLGEWLRNGYSEFL